VPTPLVPKSGSVGNSLRSDSRRFFIRFRHQRRGVINGDPRQKQQQEQLQLQLQLQLSLRGNGACGSSQHEYALATSGRTAQEACA
jgi:hypothetical protein